MKILWPAEKGTQGYRILLPERLRRIGENLSSSELRRTAATGKIPKALRDLGDYICSPCCEILRYVFPSRWRPRTPTHSSLANQSSPFQTALTFSSIRTFSSPALPGAKIHGRQVDLTPKFSTTSNRTPFHEAPSRWYVHSAYRALLETANSLFRASSGPNTS